MKDHFRFNMLIAMVLLPILSVYGTPNAVITPAPRLPNHLSPRQEAGPNVYGYIDGDISELFPHFNASILLTFVKIRLWDVVQDINLQSKVNLGLVVTKLPALQHTSLASIKENKIHAQGKAAICVAWEWA